MKLDSNNLNIGKIKLVLQASTPASPPPEGSIYFYFKDDGSLYALDEFDVETLISAGTILQTYVNIPVYVPAANTNWNTLTFATVGHIYILSTGAQNAEIEFDVDVAGGTYTLNFLSVKDTNRGIYTLYIDDVLEGTVDGYGSAGTVHVGSYSGIALSNGSHNIRLKMETKNGSSSAYYGVLFDLWLQRTGV